MEKLGGEHNSLLVAMNDSILCKSGRRIYGSGYRPDTMSPPFQVNLIRGLRVR
jgi:hypothetical protein